jgi:hypothetical protein
MDQSNQIDVKARSPIAPACAATGTEWKDAPP